MHRQPRTTLVDNAQWLDDAELVERARCGDADAFTELYRRYAPLAERIASRLTNSRADREDVASTAMSGLFRAIRNGGGPTRGAVHGYLVQAVRTSAAERKRVRVLHCERPTDVLPDVVDARESTDAWIESIDLEVRRAMAELPCRWTHVLTEVEVAGRPLRHVANELNLSPNAAAVLAKRAREGLRRRLSDREPAYA